MEIPDKIYLYPSRIKKDTVQSNWFKTQYNQDSIEYVRTDVIVERAEKYLHEHLVEYWLQKINDGSKFIDDFIDHIKGK